MSEEDIQNKVSPDNQESMKKDKVDEVRDEKKSSNTTKQEVPKNGLDDLEDDQSPHGNDSDKEDSMEDTKHDDSKEVESMDDDTEKTNALSENFELKDSLYDTKNETHDDDEDESTEESKLDESMEDSKDASTLQKSKKRENRSSSDRIPVVRGKRERKKVERFVQETKKEEVEVEGRGTPFGDIPFIRTMIAKNQPEFLKILHRLCYGRPGTAVEIKRNLYKFRGFPFKKDEKVFERKKALAEKIVAKELKRILMIFGLERGGVKIDLVERILDFMLSPEDKGKSIPTKRKRGKKGKKSKEETSKKKKGKEEEEQQQASDSDEESKTDEEGEEEEEGEGEGEEEEEEGEESEKEEEESESESEEEVKKPKKKAPPPKTPPKKAKKTPQPKKTPRSQPKTQKKRKKTPEPSSDSDDSDVEDDEPLMKKKKKCPTDTEIKAYIKRLLDKADLEQVTMKKLCQQVYDFYPGQDLAHKKDYIKATVKSILS